jgi:Rod binding domain-containing protein
VKSELQIAGAVQPANHKKVSRSGAAQDHEKLAKAAQQFEAILLKQMFSAMSSGAKQLGEKKFAGKMYDDMFMEKMANHSAENDGIGVAKLLVEEWTGTLHKPPSSRLMAKRFGRTNASGAAKKSIPGLHSPVRGRAQVERAFGWSKGQDGFFPGVSLSSSEPLQVVAPFDGMIDSISAATDGTRTVEIKRGRQVVRLLNVQELEVRTGQPVEAGLPLGMAGAKDGQNKLEIQLIADGFVADPSAIFSF